MARKRLSNGKSIFEFLSLLGQTSEIYETFGKAAETFDVSSPSSIFFWKPVSVILIVLFQTHNPNVVCSSSKCW